MTTGTRLVRGLAAALLLAASLAAASPLPAAAGGSGATIYVHVATAANTTANYTDLDNPVSNGHPDAIVFVTPVWNPGGVVAGAFDYHQVGVWWHAATGRWSIFNEDLATMPVGAAFDVYALPTPLGSIFVHHATAANSAGDFTDLPSPDTNSQPAKQVIVTPVWNPGGAGGVYDRPPLGVWYNTGTARWSIFHEDLSAVTTNASFNVYPVIAAVHGLSLHTATAANTFGYYTCVDNVDLNGNPAGIAFSTQNWNPGGAGGTYDNDVAALFYDGSRWCIWNENGRTMTTGTAFNVLAVTGPIAP